jgi:hypothetical protein
VTLLQFILKELVGANGVRVLKDAPAPGTGTAHSVAKSVSYLQAMMGEDTNYAHTKSAYGISSDSNLSEEEHKPRARKHKKFQCSKSCSGRRKKKKDKDNKPKKNTCPHCKKFHLQEAPLSRTGQMHVEQEVQGLPLQIDLRQTRSGIQAMPQIHCQVRQVRKWG